MKRTFLELAQAYIHAIQGRLDLSNNEFESEVENQGINIHLKNGYWNINNKPLINCSIVKQNLFDQYMRMKLIKSPFIERSSFKQRASDVKKQFNHTFKMREQDFIGEYPNICNMEFIKATNPNLFK